MNFLLLFLSFFNFTSNNFIDKEIEYKNEIYRSGDYYVIDDDDYFLYNENTLINDYDMNTNIQVLNCNNKTYVFSIGDKHLKVEEYDKGFKLIKEVIYDDWFIKEFNVYFENNKIYFVGGIYNYFSKTLMNIKENYFNGVDAIIFTLDNNLDFEEVKIYGGYLDESFDQCYFFKNNLYLSVRKDALTGGDFGYGGIDDTYAICILNKKLDLVNYIILKHEIIFDIKIDDYIYVATNYNAYILDFELKLKSSIKFVFESILSHITVNNSVVMFGQTEGKIYNLNTLRPISNLSYEEIKSIDIYNDGFLINNGLKKSLYKIYDITSISENEIYKGEIIASVVYDLFSELPVEVIESKPKFNPLIYGDYLISYQIDGVVFERKIKVLEEVNVTSGIIYPVGYKLNFTGIALLNNEEIVNNHQISTAGVYILELFGCNNEVNIFEFLVSNDQVHFIESESKHWDMVVYVSTEFCLEIPIQLDEKFTVESININNEHHLCEVENNVIKVRLIESIPGIITYKVKSLNLVYQDEVFDYFLGKTFKVNVLNEVCSINSEVNTSSNYLNYYMEVDDPNKTLRGINLVLIKNESEDRVNYPLGNTKMSFPVGMGEYKISLRIAYDLGDGVIREKELLETYIISSKSSLEYGEINIVEKGISNYKFNIAINKSNQLQECYVNGNIVYAYIEFDYSKYIGSGILIGFFGFTITLFIKKNRFKKRKLR